MRTMPMISSNSPSYITLYLPVPSHNASFISGKPHSAPSLSLQRAGFLPIVGVRWEKQGQKQVELRSGPWRCQCLVQSRKAELGMGGGQSLSQ